MHAVTLAQPEAFLTVVLRALVFFLKACCVAGESLIRWKLDCECEWCGIRDYCDVISMVQNGEACPYSEKMLLFLISSYIPLCLRHAGNAVAFGEMLHLHQVYVFPHLGQIYCKITPTFFLLGSYSGRELMCV